MKQNGVVICEGPVNWSIIQQMSGKASIILSGVWTYLDEKVNPLHHAQVYARIVNEDDGSDVLPWCPCRMDLHQRWSVTLQDVPAGGLYRIETCLQINHHPPLEWAIRGDMVHHIGVGDLWVIAGQSNAVGYGRGGVYDPPELGVHVLRSSGAWDMASHPLNESTGTTHPVNKERVNPRHSPFLVFGKMIKKRTGYPIGLIPSALGGSSLSRWNPDEEGTLYENMMNMVKSAGGRVRGILWYQGCADSIPEESVTYLERFENVVKHWRNDLCDALLPILTVQLNRYTRGAPSQAVNQAWGQLREAQRKAAESIPNVYIAPVLDCPLSDEIHNGPAGNMMIGERLARIALAGIYGTSAAHAAPNLTKAVYERTSTADSSAITLQFANIAGSLTAIESGENVFAVEDDQGEIEITTWKVLGKDQILLSLSREPSGNLYVHGAYEKNPTHFIPLDTGTWLPMLAFYKVKVISGGK